MDKLRAHWTSRSTADLLHKVGTDYLRQIEQKIDEGVSQGELAERLGVTKGRVSQVLNKPGNITLRNIVEYARALGLKVAVIAYDDGDPNNLDGPVDPEIFTRCWEMAGKPKDYFDIQNIRATAANTELWPSPQLRKEARTADSEWGVSQASAGNTPESGIRIYG